MSLSKLWETVNDREGWHAVVQSLSCVQLFVTPWTEACQAPLSFTISQNLLKLMSIESVMPFNHLILFFFWPHSRVSSSVSTLSIRWPNYWSFSFSINPSNKYSGLISFRIDWFDLLTVQGTLKSLLQHYSLKASIIQLLYCPTFSTVCDYWKNHSFGCMDLCRQSDVSVLIRCLGLSQFSFQGASVF